MIILEGLDATGKSTLANLLAQRLGYTVQHEKKHPDGWKRYVDQGYGNPHRVLDRFHIGELVWPIVFSDGRQPMLRWQQEMIERPLLAAGTLLVLVQASYNNIEARLKERNDKMELSTFTLGTELFEHNLKHSLLYKMSVDNDGVGQDRLDGYTLTELADVILAHYARVIVDEHGLRMFKGSGYCEPGGTMYVGEQHVNGLTIYDDLYAPFAQTTGSSPYLHQALHLTGRRDQYLTNAIKTGTKREDVRLLQLEHERLQPVRVVGLGKIAQQYLTWAGIRSDPAYHPQFIKRFHHGDIAAYAATL